MKLIYKVIIGILLINISYIGISVAQQLTQYSMFMYNNTLHNPAFLGSKNCSEVRLGGRLQWLGYDGNPRSYYLSVNHLLRLKKKPYLKSKHGIGGFIEQDLIGLNSQTNMQLGYAYHLPVYKGWFLAGGIYAGVKQYSASITNNIAPDPLDPALNGGGFTFIYPDITAGALIYSKKFFAGFAIKNIINNRLNVYGTTNSRLERQYNFMGGYNIQAGRSLVILPQVLIKKASGAPLATDFTTLFMFYRVDLGIGIRALSSIDAVVGLVNFQILPRWSLGYAFDFPLSKIQNVTFQTHEITTAIKICPNRNLGFDREECPAYSN